jgi:hypothetical protein
VLTLVLMNAWMRLRERLLDCDAWRNSHKVNFDLMLLADRMYLECLQNEISIFNF